MSRKHKTTWATTLSRTVLAATATLFLQADAALAVINCNSGVTFSSNTTLSDNYTTSGLGGACITLTNGADLNMNGKKITCTGSTIGACNVAIQATSTGSTVYNSSPTNVAINATGGGAWGTAVLNAQVVTDLRIDHAFQGIDTNYTTKITGNVITNVAQCINATMVNNSTQIHNNLCDANLDDSGVFQPHTGIYFTGTGSSTGGTIRYNKIMHAQMGIFGSGYVRIDDNINCDEVDYYGYGLGIVSGGASQPANRNLCCDAPEDTTGNACILPPAWPAPFHLWP